MPQGYYQFGGFQPHIQWIDYDDKALAKAIVEVCKVKEEAGVHVEIILGIKPTGSSHLLLEVDDVHHLAARARLKLFRLRGGPVPASFFASLSPIYFDDTEQLVKKLATLKPKSAKNKQPFDSSQANKQYVSGNEGLYRGAFEHGRLLFHLLQRDVQPRRYDVYDVSWLDSLRVVSFVFNTRANDQRPSAERVRNPVVLDIGWSETNVPGLSVREESSAHIVVYENRFLSQGSTKLSFRHGTTEELGKAEVCARLAALFDDSDRRPVVLLVHNEEVSRNVLRNFQVDVASWHSGVSELLRPEVKHEESSRGASRYSSGVSYGGDYGRRRDRRRSRSRSPSRTYGRDEKPPLQPRLDRPDDDLNARSPPRPVYVMDVGLMYQKLMQTEYAADNVATIARALGLSDTQGWCAGNEAVLAVDIWRSMISGPAIDEQRALRNAVTAVGSSGSSRATTSTTPQDSLPVSDDDEERDPNDIVQEPVAASSRAFGYDSDSDYDSD